MSSRSIAAFFRRTPWVEGLSASQVDRLVNQTNGERVARGQLIWGPDDDADRVFWVRSGCVRMERRDGDERVLILRFHGQDAVFGVAALYSSRKRGTSAIAHDDCVLLSTPVKALEAGVRARGDLGLRLSDLLIERQRSLEARLAGLVFQTVKERLLALFAELARDFGVRDSRGVILDLRLTHREMAALIGTTRETVSLTLVRLRKAGWIATADRRVVILKPRELGVTTRRRRRRV